MYRCRVYTEDPKPFDVRKRSHGIIALDFNKHDTRLEREITNEKKNFGQCVNDLNVVDYAAERKRPAGQHGNVAGQQAVRLALSRRAGGHEQP